MCEHLTRGAQSKFFGFQATPGTECLKRRIWLDTQRNMECAFRVFLILLIVTGCSNNLSKLVEKAIAPEELEIARQVATAVKDHDFLGLQAVYHQPINERDLDQFRPYFAHGELKRFELSQFRRAFKDIDGAQKAVDTFNFELDYSDGTTTIVAFQVEKVGESYKAGPLEVNDKAALKNELRYALLALFRQYWFVFVGLLVLMATLVMTVWRLIRKRRSA